MAVVVLRAPLKDLADGGTDHPVEGATVAEALRDLERAHPPLGGWILDERGKVRRHVNVFVNGERAEESSAIGTDDRIHVLPAISGG